MSDYVLIKKNWTSVNSIYHKPDPENPDKPACRFAKRDMEWMRKDVDSLPNHRLCKCCDGKVNWGSAGLSQSDLASTLDQMDPEEVV